MPRALSLKKYDNTINAMLPIYFVSNVFANVISFYITGNKNDTVRSVISWGIILAIFICISIKLLEIWKSRKIKILHLVIISIPLFLNAISILWAIASRERLSFTISEMIFFVLYCIPTYGVALYIAVKGNVYVLISNFKWIGLVMAPYFVYSCVMIILSLYQGTIVDAPGGIVYLSVAYAALLILQFNISEILIRKQLDKNTINKKELIINIINILISAVTIILCDSRGSLIALFISVGCFFAISLTSKYKNNTIIIIFISIVGIALSILLLRENSRNLMFFNEIAQGDLKTSIKSEESHEIVEKIFEKAGTGTDINQILLEDIKDNQEEIVYSITNGSMARVYLYRIAIKEANERPLMGMGPLGFQKKYMIYPHNLILEVIADYGYIVTILFIVFVLYLFIYLCKVARYSIYDLCTIIISIGQMVRMMLSIDSYVDPFLIWILTYALFVRVLGKKPDPERNFSG